MKIRVNADGFLEMLAKAEKATAKNAALPIIEHCRLEVKSGCLEIRATSLDRHMLAQIIGTGYDWEPGAAILSDTKAIIKAGKFWRGDDLEIIADDEAIAFKCGDKTAKQKTPSGDFPECLPVTGGILARYDCAKFKARYNAVKYAVCTSDTRPTLNGVLFDDDSMVAINGYQMAQNIDSDFRIAEPLVVPGDAMKLLDGVLPKAGSLEILTNGVLAQFSAENITVITRLIDKKPIAWREIMDGNTYRHTGTVYTSAMVDRLNYLKAFAGKNSPVVWDDKTLKLRAENGEYTADIEADGYSDAGAIGFNPALLLATLGQFEECVYINCDRNSAVAAMRIISQADPANRAIILPVRI